MQKIIFVVSSLIQNSRTRIAYAYDLNVFFSYLHENNPIFAQKEIRDITLDDLEKLCPTDIEEYLEYLQAYTDPKNEGAIIQKQTMN